MHPERVEANDRSSLRRAAGREDVLPSPRAGLTDARRGGHPRKRGLSGHAGGFSRERKNLRCRFRDRKKVEARCGSGGAAT